MVIILANIHKTMRFNWIERGVWLHFLAFLQRNDIQVIVKYLIFFVNSIHVPVIYDIIPQFDNIIVEVDVAVHKSIQSWF